MSSFVAIAALMILGSIGWLVRPLWVTSRWTAVTLAAGIGAASVGLYALLGTPAALDPARRAVVTPASAIDALQQALTRDPSQADGWRLLGQAQMAAGDAAQARDAFARAVQLRPNDPDLLTEAAQARAFAGPGRKFDAAAVALLRRALQQQPEHQRARWFLGVAQRQVGEPAAAADTWTSLLPQVDAKTAASLRLQIDAARAAAGLSPLPATPAAAAVEVRVHVVLDAQLAARIRLRSDAAVFVIARQPDGPPMPIAVERHGVAELPLQVTLDDTDSPMPTRPLSSLQEVELIARLSTSGAADPQPGDLESAAVRIRLPQSRVVELRIDHTRAEAP